MPPPSRREAALPVGEALGAQLKLEQFNLFCFLQAYKDADLLELTLRKPYYQVKSKVWNVKHVILFINYVCWSWSYADLIFFQGYENGNKGLFPWAVSSLQVDVLQSSES